MTLPELLEWLALSDSLGLYELKDECMSRVHEVMRDQCMEVGPGELLSPECKAVMVHMHPGLMVEVFEMAMTSWWQDIA